VVVVNAAGQRLSSGDGLGVTFAAIGAFAALPDTWPRLRAGTFALFMATFGVMRAALALSPHHPGPDGTLTISGVAGFAVSGPMPWWARLVAGFFAIVCLGAAVLGGWAIVRDLVRRRPPEE
jgi:hypothetical protein